MLLLLCSNTHDRSLAEVRVLNTLDFRSTINSPSYTNPSHHTNNQHQQLLASFDFLPAFLTREFDWEETFSRVDEWEFFEEGAVCGGCGLEL